MTKATTSTLAKKRATGNIGVLGKKPIRKMPTGTKKAASGDNMTVNIKSKLKASKKKTTPKIADSSKHTSRSTKSITKATSPRKNISIKYAKGQGAGTAAGAGLLPDAKMQKAFIATGAYKPKSAQSCINFGLIAKMRKRNAEILQRSKLANELKSISKFATRKSKPSGALMKGVGGVVGSFNKFKAMKRTYATANMDKKDTKQRKDNVRSSPILYIIEENKRRQMLGKSPFKKDLHTSTLDEIRKSFLTSKSDKLSRVPAGSSVLRNSVNNKAKLALSKKSKLVQHKSSRLHFFYNMGRKNPYVKHAPKSKLANRTGTGTGTGTGTVATPITAKSKHLLALMYSYKPNFKINPNGTTKKIISSKKLDEIDVPLTMKLPIMDFATKMQQQKKLYPELERLSRIKKRVF